MSTLQKTIEARAVQFASAIVQALRSASLDELVTITGGGGAAAPSRAPRAKTNGAAPKTNGAAVAAPLVAKKGGRLGRRSPGDIANTLGQIVALLGKHADGLRAEQIKAALNLDTREMPRPLAEGLSTGVLKKTGNKRATVYTAVGSKKKK